MTVEKWLIIRNWDQFQHYKDRDPKWVKNWVRLLSDDDYISLSFHLRGILHGLWISYATANGQLRDTTSTLHRQLGHRVLTRDIESLIHAGFITRSDTKPARIRTSEKEIEKEGLTNTKSRERASDPSAYTAVATMIANGAITDQVDLDAELRARNLNGDTERQLRALLANPTSNPTDGQPSTMTDDEIEALMQEPDDQPWT